MALGRDMIMFISAIHQILVLATLLASVSTEKYSRPPFCKSVEQSEDGSEDKSFLWRLKGREPPVYFFGTIHVAYTRVWSYIPENVKRAFQEADSVYFELDLIDPYTIAALAKCQMLPSGESLADLLPKDVYLRLKKHLDYVRGMIPSWLGPPQDHRGGGGRGSAGLYADYLFNAIAGNWERKRPIWIMLMVNSLTESDIRARGIPVLDLYLAQEAQRMEKHSGAVEKVDEQCVPLNGLNFTQVLFALNQTLVQQENLRSGDPYPGFTTDDLIKHYNCGDLDSVYLYKEGGGQVPQFSNSSSLIGQDSALAKNIDQYFKNELVHKRNARMAQRVIELIRKYPDESFFFAFGAGHFLGNNTVLDYVASRGFPIDKVPPEKRLRGNKKFLPQFRHRHKSHHHHRGAQIGEDITDESDNFLHMQSSRLGSRRRYRKRQNHHHHHHGVHLLRTSTAASPSTRRTFNDLWIKMEDVGSSTSNKLPEASQDSRNYEEKLRAWYGIPNSSVGRSSVDLTRLVVQLSCCVIVVSIHVTSVFR